jgi:hypothetical protein
MPFRASDEIAEACDALHGEVERGQQEERARLCARTTSG